MKLFDRLDGGMGARTWVAPPSRSFSTTQSISASEYPRESLSRQPSIGRLDQLGRLQASVDDQARKLKEQRLAELTRQLELTELQQQHPSRPQHLPSPRSQPLSPSSKLPPEPLLPSIEDLDRVWEHKLLQAEELNARIESLRLSGVPPDRLPSPVRLSSRPLSRVAEDPRSAHTSFGSTPSHAYPLPSLPNLVSEPSLKRQTSKRSLHSISSTLPTTSPIAGPSSNAESRNRSTSASHASHYKALKEAEELICKLRQSHDDLLVRVNELEQQLHAKEAENHDLVTRNNRLETFLTEEQKIKENLQRENERSKIQLRLLARASAPMNRASSVQSNPQSELLSRSCPPGRPYPSQVVTGTQDQGMSRARVELVKREENLRRQYEHHSDRPFYPEISRPASNSAYNFPPTSLPIDYGAQAINNDKAYGPTHPTSTASHYPMHAQLPTRLYRKGESLPLNSDMTDYPSTTLMKDPRPVPVNQRDEMNLTSHPRSYQDAIHQHQHLFNPPHSPNPHDIPMNVPGSFRSHHNPNPLIDPPSTYQAY